MYVFPTMEPPKIGAKRASLCGLSVRLMGVNNLMIPIVMLKTDRNTKALHCPQSSKSP
jgi:hypothetical protein